MRKRSLKSAIAVFATGLIVVGAICWGVGAVIGLTIRDYNREVAQAQMTTSEMSTDLFFAQTWQQLASLLVDPMVRSAIGKLTNYIATAESALPDPAAYGGYELSIADRLSDIQRTAVRITQIEVGMADGGFVMYPPSPRIAGYDPRLRPWYASAIKGDAEMSKTEARLTSDGKNLVISLVGKIRDPAGAVAGAGAISVSLTDLTRIIDSTRIGRRGYLLLFQEDGVLVADPKRPEFLAKSASEIPDAGYSSIIAARGSTKPAMARIAGAYYELSYHTFKDLGFFEVALLSEEDFLEQLGPILMTLTVITLVIAGLACAAFLIMSTRERVNLIKERESYFRRAFEEVKLLVAGIDKNGKIQFANDYLCEWSGYPKGSIVSKKWYDLFLPPGIGPREPLPTVLEDKGESCRIEEKTRIAAGDERIVAWTKTTSYDDKDRIVGIMLIGEDVTEKRRQEELMEKAMEEKELLLHEVHHRVKNNLQLIASLLALQGKETPAAARRFLRDAHNRVQSLALVHECLYSAKDYSGIDFGDYATQVTASLISSFGNSRISFVPDIGSVTLSLDEAIPCGLILNEAVTNVLKYAFPPGWAGSQRIELRVGPAGEGRRMIEVRDNGVGMPLGFDPSRAETLGCTIMRLLANQLAGRLSISSRDGTIVMVEF